MFKRKSEPDKRTAEGRSRTLERQQERRKQRRRQQQLLIAASIGVLAVIAIALTLILNQPADAPLPDDVTERYANLVTGVSENNFPRLGETDGTIRVIVYASFADTQSRAFHDDVLPHLVDRVRTGDISVTFAPLTSGIIPNGEGAARAALCAGEQGGFWQYQDALFFWQGEYERQAFPPNRLSAGIERLGLNQTLYDACFNGDRVRLTLQTAEQQARQLTDQRPSLIVAIDGVTVAPTIEAIDARVDERLAFLRGLSAPEVTPEITPEVETNEEVEDVEEVDEPQTDSTPEPVATEEPTTTEDEG